MALAPGETLRFSRFEVWPSRRELTVDGRPAALGGRAFDLLLALIERRDRVVGKNELLESVWPGLIVEENNLQVQVSALRKLLGPQVIATIPGRGYRFTAMQESPGSAGPEADSMAGPDAVPSPLPSRTNLPLDPPVLFGRERDQTEATRLIREHRLVTITGAGGIGKTRLARAVAASMLGEYADGVWSVELASIAEGSKAFAAVAQTLGVNLSGVQTPERVLALALAGQRLLLVLDNCEHLLGSVAALAEALLDSAPGIRLLVTSQEPLKLARERQFRLGSLRIPDAIDLAAGTESGAVALFIDRAQAADPRFALTEGNLGAVIDVCRHLDGIPLAIELAAARVSLLGVDALRDRLGERFRVLTAGSRLALRRHQTLHAALQWSHGLLSADEQVVFRRLGVFTGGCTLEAAQQVVTDDRIDEWAALEHLGALVDKSLVVAQGESALRYALLETTRAFALERLAEAGETDALLGRHARVIAALFGRTDEERFGDQGTLSDESQIDRAVPEIDNLRAALAWASGAAGDATLAIALAAASTEALFVVGLAAEGLATLRALIPRVTPETDGMLATRFWFAVSNAGRDGRIENGTYAPALELAERGCRDLGWTRRLCMTLTNRAWWLIRQDDVQAAESVLAAAAAVERAEWPGWIRSDRWNTAQALLLQKGAVDDVPEVLERIAGLLPRQGEERRRNRLNLNTGAYWNACAQYDKALSVLKPLVEGLQVRRRYAGMLGWAYGALVLTLTQLGRLDEARRGLTEGLPLWRADGVIHVMAHVVVRLLAAEGRIADAARLTGAEDAFPLQYGRQIRLASRIRSESRHLIEAAAPDLDQRARWRREGEVLDEAAIVALCSRHSDAA